MSRRTKKAALAERQDPAAPYLFDEEQMPLRPDVVELVKQGHHVHTGARLLENEKLCQRMVEMLMGRWGLKKIAATLGVSKWSVKAAREALVLRGEMAPWKERVVSIFSEIVEQGAENYREALESGTVPTTTIPVGVGIFADKRALALGEPTSIGLQASAALDRDSISVERLRAWVSSIDSDSDGKKRICSGTDKTQALGATLGATKAVGGGGGSGGLEGADALTDSVEANTRTKEDR